MSIYLLVLILSCLTSLTHSNGDVIKWRLYVEGYVTKAVANGLVGQVLARPLFLKVKAKFHFTKSK